MNKQIAVLLGCFPILGLFIIALMFVINGVDDSKNILLEYTPLIAISNAVVAIAAIAPFVMRIYQDRPLIEIDYSKYAYSVDGKHWQSLMIRNYGTAEARNPSLRLLHVVDNDYIELFNCKYRYALLNGHHFDFGLNDALKKLEPKRHMLLIAEVGYDFFFRREKTFIPFKLDKVSIYEQNIATGQTSGPITFLKPVCLEYDQAIEILDRLGLKDSHTNL